MAEVTPRGSLVYKRWNAGGVQFDLEEELAWATADELYTSGCRVWTPSEIAALQAVYDAQKAGDK